MSDFLDQLLARSYHPLVPGAVRPRPVARFETPDESGLPPSSLQTPVPGGERADSPVLPASSTVNQPATAAFTARPQAVQDQLPTRRVTVDFGKPRPLQSVLEPEQQSGIFGETGNQVERRRPSEGPATGFQNLDQMREALLSVIEQTETPPPVIQPSPGPPPLPAPPNSAAFLSAGELIPAPPGPDGPRLEPEPGAAIPAPAVVQLTIGRIEVNPPPAPPAPSAARRPPAVVRPVRSLDDYLNQRNKGKT